MPQSSDITTRVHAIAQSLEAARSDLSAALSTPACSGGVTDIERVRLEDLHRRIASALSALNGEVRDW